jgi:sugar phosphate isomerase/epimerase
MTSLQRMERVERLGDKTALPLVSVGSWAFAFGPYEPHPWSFEKVCRYAAEAGYDGVEINGFRPHPHPDDFVDGEGLKELSSLLSGFGLGVSGYAPDYRRFPPARVPTKVYTEEIDKARAVCEALEIPVLRVDTILDPAAVAAEGYEEAFAQLVRSWNTAAERCALSGTALVWEFEPGFWLNRPSEINRLLREVDHPNFGILFDSSHAYTGGVMGARQGEDPELVDSVVTYAEALLPYIRHLHLADSDGTLHDQDTSTHVPLGRGRVDFPGLVRALSPIASRLGWWCVDLCYCDGADVKATAALAYVRQLLDQLRAEGP